MTILEVPSVTDVFKEPQRSEWMPPQFGQKAWHTPARLALGLTHTLSLTTILVNFNVCLGTFFASYHAGKKQVQSACLVLLITTADIVVDGKSIIF